MEGNRKDREREREREAEGSTCNDDLKVSPPSLSLRLMLQCLQAQEVVTISYEG